MYQLGWFTSARGPGSRGLFKTVHDDIVTGEIPANIEFVFCSRGFGESEATDFTLNMMKSLGIQVIPFSVKNFKADHSTTLNPAGSLPQWRQDYDREVILLLKEYDPDLCIMAGYMLIVSAEMCRKYNFLNIHPATPTGPKGTWQEVIWELIATRAKESGVMAHLVTPDLDRGPCVSYCTFPIDTMEFTPLWAELGGHTLDEIKSSQGEEFPLFKLIRKHGVEREGILLAATIKAFAEEKIMIRPDKQVVDEQGLLIKGYDLTAEVNSKLARPLPRHGKAPG